MATDHHGRSESIASALKKVEQLYSDNLTAHGVRSAAVGWPDADAQLLRFEKLSHVFSGQPASAPISVADWGCGYGAMFDFLDSLPDLELANYRGYDISPAMIDAAQARVEDPRADFRHGDVVDRDCDYIFVSGTFNVRMEAGEAEWAQYVRRMLRDLWAHARRGLAFNLLTVDVDWRAPSLFYADPMEFFAFCRAELSPRVALLHDYPLYEWTMCVRRDAPR